MERLRGDWRGTTLDVVANIADEAADEIERLRAQMTIFENVNRTDRDEIERLRAVLMEIAEDRPRSHPIDIARRALEGR